MADRLRRAGAPLPVAALVAAVWAAALTYVPLLILAGIGMVGSAATASGAARLATAGWLLGHGVPVETPADRITLVPLAVTGLAAWRVCRAGVHASRACGGHRDRSVGKAMLAALAVAAAYAGVGFLAASMATSDALAVGPARAGLSLGVFGWVAASAGALRHSRAGRRLLGRVPAVLEAAVRAGICAALLMLAGGAAVAGVALALRGDEAAQMLGSYRAGLLGQGGITVVCLAYSPNVAVWASAYLLGPGFALGVDTLVSPAEVRLGPVPAVPILAGAASSDAVGFASLLLGVPLAGAVWAGWLLASRVGRARAVSGRELTARPMSWSGLAAAAMVAGPVAGICLALASSAASGALGSGRLSLLGPDHWQVGLVAAIIAATGVLGGAVAARTLTRGGARVGQPRANRSEADRSSRDRPSRDRSGSPRR